MVAAPAMLGVWWAIHLLSNIANQVSFRVGMKTEDADLLYGIAWLDLFLLLFDSGVALVEIWIVKTLTNMQGARAEAAAASAVPAYPYPYAAPAPAMAPPPTEQGWPGQ